VVRVGVSVRCREFITRWGTVPQTSIGFGTHGECQISDRR
jgi:hypothetical protein